MDITNYLIDCVNHNIPVSFSKYGDGELACMLHNNGYNCDRDSYTDKLSDGLRISFIYMVEKADNAYIGMWHYLENIKALENIVKKDIKWALYHTIIIDKQNDQNKSLLYKTIKHSKLKKIIVCNQLLIKSKFLLDIDEIVFVPFNNWFDTQFDTILNQMSVQLYC
jgi:hypothetical protein